MFEEEDICRIICKAEGVDPDVPGFGLGNIMPAGTEFELCEARKRVARALIEAGYGRT